MAFGIDLIMTDTSKVKNIKKDKNLKLLLLKKTKRRVNLTTAVNKIDLNFFHVKIPIEIIKRGVWLNLAIDVLSFMDAFKSKILIHKKIFLFISRSNFPLFGRNSYQCRMQTTENIHHALPTLHFQIR